jgi:hypothetical protein
MDFRLPIRERQGGRLSLDDILGELKSVSLGSDLVDLNQMLHCYSACVNTHVWLISMRKLAYSCMVVV